MHPKTLTRGPAANRSTLRRTAAAMLLACATLLGAGTAWAQTLVSNTGQTEGERKTLTNQDLAQAFTTGSDSTGYVLTGIEVQWWTSSTNVVNKPASTDTVTAIVTDGLGSSATTVATLTNPMTWTKNSTFTAPSGTNLAANTTYYLILEGTDGSWALTTSSSEDSGGASGFSIANGARERTDETLTGVGGTWGNITVGPFMIKVEGHRVGEAFTCSAASMEDQIWTGTLTVGASESIGFGDQQGFTSTEGSLNDTTFVIDSTTYTIERLTTLRSGTLEALTLDLDQFLASGQDAILHVGNAKYQFSEASTTNAASQSYTWNNTNIAWNQHDRVCLAITEVDDTPPAVLAAEVSINTGVGVFFDETIASTSIPAKSAYTVKVEGTSRTVTSAVRTSLGQSIVLSVDPVIRPGEAVTVSYTKPATNPLQDAAGNEVESFTDQAVTNKLAATAPEAPGSLQAADGTNTDEIDLSWTTPWANGAEIMKFQVRQAEGTSVPGTTMWTDIDGSGPTTTSHTIDGLTQGTEYTFEVRAVNSVGGGSEAAVTATVNDVTAPVLATATIVDLTDWLRLTFNEALDTTSVADKSAFEVKVEGESRGIANTSIVSSDSNVFVLTLSSEVRPGETVTVSYTKPGTNPIRDASANNNEAASFSNQAVANNIPAKVPEAPGNLSASPSGTDSMILRWDTPWHNGSDITKFQVRHVEGTTAGGTFADIDNSGPTTTEHTVTGLTAGSTYTFEVLATNGEGDGSASSVTETVSAPTWEFTLKRTGNNVTRLTEGGAHAVAAIRITNDVRFSSEQFITLKWGTEELGSGLIQNQSVVLTIESGAANGSAAIHAPQRTGDLYHPNETRTLTANLGGSQIGDGIELTYVDDEAKPELTLYLSPNMQHGDRVSHMRVVEGATLYPFATLNRGYDLTPGRGPSLYATMTGPTNKFLPLSFQTVGGETVANLPLNPPSTTETLASSLSTVDNGTAGDHSEHVFTLPENDDFYTIGSPSSATLVILDNDAAPTAPRNLTAAPGNGQVTLTWDHPTSYDTVAQNNYGVFYGPESNPTQHTAPVPGGGTATSHTITGLTNGDEYFFSVRVDSANAQGAVSATVKATPREHGVNISDTRITESETSTITVIPQGGPFTGLTAITLVAATHSGADRPVDGSDFEVRYNNARVFGYSRTFNRDGFSGRQRHYNLHLPAGQTALDVAFLAKDDDISECDETVTLFAFLQYGTSNQAQIGVAQTIELDDDDNRASVDFTQHPLPTLQSATVSGRTVTLNFDGLLDAVNPADDPLLEEGEIPAKPRMFFTLYEGKNASATQPNIAELPGQNGYPNLKHPFGVGARTVDIDDRTVTLTFEQHVDTTHNAWVHYDKVSRYSPLAMRLPEPKPGRCVVPIGVNDFIQQVPMNGPTPDPLPVITITQAASGTEGTDTDIAFTVTMAPASDEIVTVDYKTVSKTATEGEDFTRTRGTLRFEPGQTTKTVRVPITDDTVEDTNETFLLDLTAPSGATMDERTSHGTGTIINSEDDPTGNEVGLIASFANMPTEHGGAGEANQFSFDLSFSENVNTGFRKVRDHAFVVAGGDVKKVRRKARGDGTKNQHWTIWVEPAGLGAVTITLPGGRTCGAYNAICTPDNRPISNSPSATVIGPAGLSVADTTANENTDQALNFTVSLDRVSTLPVSVDWATSDGTATAGEDYVASSGTLTFNPGTAAKSIQITLIGDAIDEDPETMTLTLSNARNAHITDATAIGTIENSDPLQKAWIARFGRTVASDVVDGITDRLANPRASSEVRIAGITLQQADGTWTEAPREAPGPESLFDDDRPQAGQDITAEQLLTQSAFHLQGTSDTPGGPAWAAWGRVSTSSFDGKEEGITLSGDVVTGLLGADVATDAWTAGLALSAAKGDGPFTITETTDDAVCKGGTVDSTLTSVHPYAQVQLNPAVALWGVAGYGTGDMTIDQDCSAAITTDIDMTMAAAGVRGQLLSAHAGDAIDSTVRTDVLWLRTTSDSKGTMAAAEADVTRLRLMVDAARPGAAGTGTLTPSVEIGVRHDAGDAEEGVGLELGAGLAFQAPGVILEGKVRTLIAHDDDAYEEWGASAAVRIDPGSDGRGMSLTITPTWGSAASEAEQLWSTRTAEDLVSDSEFEATRRLDAELGYGLSAPLGFGTLTPYTGLSLTDGAERTVKAGARWAASQNATLGLEAARTQSGAQAPAANAVMLRAQLRF